MTAQLKRYFRRVEELKSSFEEYFWQIPRNLLQDAVDAKWLLVAFAKVIFRMEPTAKSRLTAVWDDIVSSKFAIALTGAQSGGDFLDTLKTIAFWLPDLEVIRDGLMPAFPPDFAVLDHFALVYHRNVYGVLQHLTTRVKPLITPADILGVLAWMRDYYGTMSLRFGFGEESLEPRLLGDREVALIRIYTDQSHEKLTTWTNNLLASEVRSFTTREGPPDLDAEDQYLTPAAVDLYQIIKQNIETAYSSQTPSLIASVIESAVKAVAEFQRGIQRALQQEISRFCDPAMQRQLAPHFEQYVMMVGNSALCWVRFMDELATKLEKDTNETLASPTILSAIKTLRDVNEGFMTIAKDTVDVLVKVMMLATAPAYSSLFTSDWYESSDAIDSICATFEDFFTDYQAHYNPFLIKRLVAQVLDAHILAYVEAMRGRNVKLRPPMVGLQRDALAILKCFVGGGWREEKRVEKAFEPLNRLCVFLTASPKLLFMEGSSLLKACPDLKLAVLEEIITKRSDLDKATIKDAFEALKDKAREERENAPEVVTIFSKLKPRKQ